MTICSGWHTYLIRVGDPEDALTADDVDFKLAVGDDNSVTPTYSDTSLTNEVTRTNVTDFVNEGTNLYTSTFLDSTEANPTDGSAYQSIVEIGIVIVVDATTEYLANHSTIAEIQKNSNKTATIDSTLELNDDTNDA